MTGVTHPEGCRCPGCLPGQYVMRPDRPAVTRPARVPPGPPDRRPVYRYPPRSHADSCRCPRCEPFRRPAKGGPAYQFIDRNGIIGPAVLVIGGIILTCFWPVLVWHGEGGVTGTDWRWDIHSTIAEAVYLGSVSFVIFLCWLGNRPAKRAVPPRGRLRVEATPVSSLPPPPPSVCVQPPACRHLNAVRVEDIADPERKRAVAYWCEQCETQLPGEFGRLMRSCCGTPPGERHLYNCPQAARG